MMCCEKKLLSGTPGTGAMLLCSGTLGERSVEHRKVKTLGLGGPAEGRKLATGSNVFKCKELKLQAGCLPCV